MRWCDADFLVSAPHVLFFPGAAIFVTVVAFVLVGDGLRDALDPRMGPVRPYNRARP